MPNPRKIVFANDQIYHIYNRGFDKRVTFSASKDYYRAIETLKYYVYSGVSISYGQFLLLSDENKTEYLTKLKSSNKLVEVLCFCLMPNHFHLILKQKVDGGIIKFISNFSNSYVKFFNSKNNRGGGLFQGPFKAVWVSSDDQLIHLSRYVHLNPVTSYIIEVEKLPEYNWSSFPDYLTGEKESWLNKNVVMSNFKTPVTYRKFVYDQAEYAKVLKRLEHLLIEK